jgi:hypothetical protein
MPSLIMTVKLINEPEGENSRGSIVGTDGARLGLFSEKLHLFEVGKTYEIEYTEKPQGNRTLRNVRSAKQVAAPATLLTTSTPSPTTTSGRNTSVCSPPAGQPFRTPEQITVAEITCAYITAGKCSNPAELKQTMQAICNAFRATWPDMEHYSEAAE